jgi:hypothetical protein
VYPGAWKCTSVPRGGAISTGSLCSTRLAPRLLSGLRCTLMDYFLARVPAWMRVAVEFRHPSWHDETVFALLERHQAAYCVKSGAYLPNAETLRRVLGK